MIEREAGNEAGSEAGSDDGGQGTSDDSESSPTLLPAIAVDGKTLRGARLHERRAVHLLSAMTHQEGATVAQRIVETKTNEITGFAPLLAPVDLAGVVVTADPMHAQRSHARFLVEDKNAYYVDLRPCGGGGRESNPPDGDRPSQPL